MSLVDRLFSAAQNTARFLIDDSEPLQEFKHDKGTITGWFIGTVDHNQGVGWSARTDVILTKDGELLSLYIRETSASDTEDLTPCKSLHPITKDEPWPDSHKRRVLQLLAQMQF